MKRSPIAVLTAMLASALFVFGTAAPALAHDALKNSNPAKGAKIKALDEVRLEFSAKVRMPFVIVRGDGDSEHHTGKPEVDGAVVRQAVAGPLPDGKYTIAYRVVSSDGHPIEGEIPFRVEGADSQQAAAATSGATEPDAGPPGASSSAEPGASSSAEADVSGSAEPDASPPATQAAPSAGAPSSAGTSAVAADEAAGGQDASFPVWLIVVIGALIGIGIGFLFSARRKQP